MQLLWQVDIGYNDDAQGGWRILGLLTDVSARVVLVDGAAAGLPGLRVGDLGDRLLRGGGGWRACCSDCLC